MINKFHHNDKLCFF